MNSRFIKNADKVCQELCKERDKNSEVSFELFKKEELGVSNPESGTWFFTNVSPPNEVPFKRIWIKRVIWIQITEGVWRRKDYSTPTI